MWNWHELRNSIGEYLKAFYYFGLVWVIGLIGGIIGIVLYIFDIAEIPIWIWITLVVIAFPTVSFIAFHKVRFERDEIKSNWSKVSIRPLYGNKWAYLEVKNIGVDKASFCARLQQLIYEGIDPIIPQDILWRESPVGDKWISIPKDGEAILQVCHEDIERSPYIKDQGIMIMEFPGSSTFDINVYYGSSMRLNIEIYANPRLEREFKRSYILRIGIQGDIKEFAEYNPSS